jgi:RNA polymerase sigma-70 factor, ECF subfamily
VLLLRAYRVGGVPLGSPRRLDPERLGDHLDRLFRAAWALCGDRDEGEDLVQETYLRVLARPRFVRAEDDLGYLLRALRNTHLNRVRRQRRRPHEVPREEDSPADAERFDMRRPELAFEVGEVFDVISALPPDAREAIVAVDVAGLSYREAAGALRINEGTLTTRLHRARRRVAAELAAEPRRSAV